MNSLRVLRVTCTVLLVLLLSNCLVCAGRVQIELWGWTPGSLTGDMLARLIDEFNSSQSEVEVVVSQQQSGFDKFLVAYAAGTAPDVMFNVGDMAYEVGGPGGALLPLDQYIDGPNGIPREAFVDDLWSYSVVEGKTYQLAIEGNERGLFVNANLAAQAGLDTTQSRPIEDWEDLLAWAKKLTVRRGEEVSQWGFNANHPLGGDKWHWVWLNDGKLIAEDGSKSQFTHPNTVEAFQFAADLIHMHGVAPPDHKGGVRDAFINGRYAMVLERSTMVQWLHNRGFEDFITVAGPRGVGKEGGRFSGATASAIAIINSTEHPDEAWQFVRWIVFEKGLEFAGVRGGIPFLLEGLRSEKFRKQPWEAFAHQILTFRPEHLPRSVPIGSWYPLFNAAWSAVITGEKPASIALSEAAEACDAQLAALTQGGDE